MTGLGASGCRSLQPPAIPARRRPPSFPRKGESTAPLPMMALFAGDSWIPAFAGMTVLGAGNDGLAWGNVGGWRKGWAGWGEVMLGDGVRDGRVDVGLARVGVRDDGVGRGRMSFPTAVCHSRPPLSTVIPAKAGIQDSRQRRRASLARAYGFPLSRE